MRNKNCIKVSVSIPEELVRSIDELARSRDETRSRIIVKAVEFMLQIRQGGSYL